MFLECTIDSVQRRSLNCPRTNVTQVQASYHIISYVICHVDSEMIPRPALRNADTKPPVAKSTASNKQNLVKNLTLQSQASAFITFDAKCIITSVLIPLTGIIPRPPNPPARPARPNP